MTTRTVRRWILLAMSVAAMTATPAQAGSSAIEQLTTGRLRGTAEQVFEADNETVAAWAKQPGPLLQGYRPTQHEYLKAFVGLVDSYKTALATSYQLFSPGTDDHPGYGQYIRLGRTWVKRIPFDEADLNYRRFLDSNDGRSGPLHPANYQNYLAAMMAKAGIAYSLFKIMAIDGGYSQAALEEMLRHGLTAAGLGRQDSQLRDKAERVIADMRGELDRLERTAASSAAPGPGTPKRAETPAPPAARERDERPALEVDRRSAGEPRSEVVFAFWVQEVLVHDDLWVTVLTDPQAFPSLESDTVRSAPLELQEKAREALRRYLVALGFSGEVSAGWESIVAGSFQNARRTVRDIYDRRVADRRRQPSDHQVFRFAIINPETGEALQELSIAHREDRKRP